MNLGEIIGLAFLVLAIIIVVWTRRPRAVLNRAKRKAIITGQLPKTNGQGSKRLNKRVWSGRTRKARPAPPAPNGHGKQKP